MDAPSLSKGQNLPLPDDCSRLQVLVEWRESRVGSDVDAAALMLTDDRRIRSDEDFVFYNQPESTDGSVRHLGPMVTEQAHQEGLSIDLEAVSADVGVVALTASLDRGTFADVDGLAIHVLGADGAAVAAYEFADATSESAILLGEVYRRDGAWKFRAVGQGWASGLAGLATDFGVTVEDEAPDAAEDAAHEDLGTTPEPVAELDVPVDVSVDAEQLVEVTDGDAADEGGGAATAPAPPASSDADTDSPRVDRRTGVRTRKPVRRAVVAPLVLAGSDSWQPARVFSISGVGTAEEQEKRATSALLSTMMAVREFGRALSSRFGAPAGTLETYLEVPFELGEARVIPDGVLRVARGGRLWTGLLEVKTGTAVLRREQVENYLDVARAQGFESVVTLSNEIAPAVGEHPLSVDRRKLRKVSLHHISWAEVLHEARMTLFHRGVTDPVQAWLLAELIRYLEHPRSGASGFDDMGPSWVPVREAVAAGTLRATDRKIAAVAEAWTRLVRHLCLRLSSELGVTVAHLLPRRLANDPTARVNAVVTRLAGDGVLDATLRVPGAVGPLEIRADLRTGQVRSSVLVQAPQEGGSQRRLNWALRQLKEAPDDLLVEVLFSGRTGTTCERLADVRETPAALLPEGSGDVTAVRLTQVSALGTKRSGVKGAFVPSVTSGVEAFYRGVVERMKPWVPPAPKLPAEVIETEPTASADAPEPEAEITAS